MIGCLNQLLLTHQFPEILRSIEVWNKDELEKLLRRCSTGDADAFTKLYQLTSPRVYGLLLRITKDSTEAETQLQEVYEKIWRKAGTFNFGSSNAAGWIVITARNHAIDNLRKKSIEPQMSFANDAFLADPRPNPESALIKSDEASRLNDCIEELKPERAAAVRSVYLDGDTYATLARRAGVPLNTMRTWLRRSLISIRMCLER